MVSNLGNVFGKIYFHQVLLDLGGGPSLVVVVQGGVRGQLGVGVTIAKGNRRANTRHVGRERVLQRGLVIMGVGTRVLWVRVLGTICVFFGREGKVCSNGNRVTTIGRRVGGFKVNGLRGLVCFLDYLRAHTRIVVRNRGRTF